MNRFQTVIAVAGMALLPMTTSAQDKSAASAVTPEQRKAFEGVIKDYLLKNPIIIREAIQALQAQEEAAKQAQAAAALKTHKDQLFYDKTSPVAGNPKGDITVVEFFDYNCGYCKRVTPTIKAVMEKDPNLRVVYKEFAILGPQSITAARAALAAQKQGKYKEFHEGLMMGQSDENSIAALTNLLGMDYSKLRKDMADPKIQQVLQKNYQLATTLGINGTPAFVIGERLVTGAIGEAALTQIIKEERARLKSKK
ncbi:MAG: DsbA family protein [Alphaproteobacteria bacterium]